MIPHQLCLYRPIMAHSVGVPLGIPFMRWKVANDLQTKATALRIGNGDAFYCNIDSFSAE